MASGKARNEAKVKRNSDSKVSSGIWNVPVGDFIFFLSHVLFGFLRNRGSSGMGWGQSEAVGITKAGRQEGNWAGPGNNESLAAPVPGGWTVRRDKPGEIRWGRPEGQVLRSRQYPWVLAP